MLVKIQRPADRGGASADAAGAADFIDALLACHERIRRFVGLAHRLGQEEILPPADVAEAAEAVRRYFGEALPLHAADEDQSLRPRLLSVGVPTAVEEALARMSAEHAAIDAVLVEAAPLWGALSRESGRRPALRGALADVARRLDHLFQAHLAPEEQLIFPLARRCLEPAVLAEAAREVRLRRAARLP